MKFRFSFLIVSLFVIVGFSPKNNEATNSPNGKYRGAEMITAAQLKDYLTFIAADELEGRDTPSRGLNTAAKFIATNLSRWGVKPAGDTGTYFQRIALLKSTVDLAQSFLEINRQRFRFGADFIVNPNAGSGTASGPLIYVSHGSIFPKKNIDAFQGLDVKGKIVVWTNEFPKGTSEADFFGKAGVDWVDPIKYAAKSGALGIISIARFQTLAIAEAFAKSVRPKRSLLFVWHTGEEKGLWGSEYFVKHPTVPIDQIVTQLNLDMIGRSKKAGDTNPRNEALTGPNEIYVVGSRMMSTALGELSESVNKSYYNLTFNYKYDDPNDPNRFFFRSDHFNYAQKGIPIIFYFDGEHEDYHRVTDHVEKIDFEKMQKVARTVYATAWELAGGKKRPAVDKKLPAELMSGLF